MIVLPGDVEGGVARRRAKDATTPASSWMKYECTRGSGVAACGAAPPQSSPQGGLCICQQIWLMDIDPAECVEDEFGLQPMSDAMEASDPGR